ncbi:MAG: hypothetical protein R3B54_10135 [Bdellovibrionota bacterium]
MRQLFLLGLILSTTVFSADIKKMDAKNLLSDSLADLIPTIKGLHDAGEKEYSPAGGRVTAVYKVTPAKDEKEWQAMRALVDKANSFGEVGGEDVGEDATAFFVKRPNFEHISVAFVSDYLDRDELSDGLVEELTKFRDRLRDLIKEKSYLGFYRIFSSNEAQGHLGFVLYNRSTDEALYVSTVSDH